MSTNLKITKGSCFVLFAFEVGESIDCEGARASIKSVQYGEGQFRPRQNPTPFFGFDPPPLKVINTVGEFRVGKKLPTSRTIEISLWSFGVASVKFEIPLSEGTTLSDLLDLSLELGKDQALEIEALKQVKSLVTQIGDAVEDPIEPANVEDYVIFSVPSFVEEGISAESLLKNNRLQLAQILRQESVALSNQVQSDATKFTFSWADDLTVVDWGGAFLYGKDNEDVMKLLEFELVQQLELRYLDELLDSHCRRAAELFRTVESELRTRNWSQRLAFRLRHNAIGVAFFPSSVEVASHEVGELTMDAIKSASVIGNAINLLGDPTLDSLHSIAAKRFRLQELSDSVERKRDLLDNLYEKIETRLHSKKSIFWEIIVVLLILFEIVAPLFFKIFRH